MGGARLFSSFTRYYQGSLLSQGARIRAFDSDGNRSFRAVGLLESSHRGCAYH